MNVVEKVVMVMRKQLKVETMEEIMMKMQQKTMKIQQMKIQKEKEIPHMMKIQPEKKVQHICLYFGLVVNLLLQVVITKKINHLKSFLINRLFGFLVL